MSKNRRFTLNTKPGAVLVAEAGFAGGDLQCEMARLHHVSSCITMYVYASILYIYIYIHILYMYVYKM